MAHAIWSGTVGFGLVMIPVKLFPAVQDKGGVHFRFLHDEDAAPLRNERVCSECGRRVPWEHVARGYEYEKGRFVVVTEEELKRASPEATQSVDIVQFVAEREIDPLLAQAAYYLEPEKKGRRAYALLREALRASGRVGIARVVLRSRERLAMVRPEGSALVVELLHWADELVPVSTFDLPAVEKPSATEMKAAATLIDTMTGAFDAASFHDTYAEKVHALVERKAQGKPTGPKKAGAPPAANVVDLVSILERSLAKKRTSAERAPRVTPRAARR